GNPIRPTSKDIWTSFREQGKPAHLLRLGPKGSAALETKMGPQSAETPEDEKTSKKAITQLRGIYWRNNLDRRHEERREQDIMRPEVKRTPQSRTKGHAVYRRRSIQRR